MSTWYTGRPCERTDHSHINFCVYDSTWEAAEAFELDHNPAVSAWVKDHLAFEILYITAAWSASIVRTFSSASPPADTSSLK